MSELRINISRLSEGVHEFELEAEPEDIGLDDRFNGVVRVDAAVDKTNRQLLLQARIATKGRFTCDRCLEHFQRALTSEYSVVYIQQGHSEEEQDAGGEELHILSPEANMIDLGEDVRQFTILSLPIKMLCHEECAGLCPVCGTNLNNDTCDCTTEEIDPRWEELKKISEN